VIWGAELHPSLAVDGEVVRKGSQGEDCYSGFTERDPVRGDEKPTILEQTLRSKGVQKAIVVGLATDYCVKATALDAIERGLDVTVLSEAVRAVNREPNDGADALDEVEGAGGHVS
jgi:nicotinamidase/pyrazinamidase